MDVGWVSRVVRLNPQGGQFYSWLILMRFLEEKRFILHSMTGLGQGCVVCVMRPRVIFDN